MLIKQNYKLSLNVFLNNGILGYGLRIVNMFFFRISANSLDDLSTKYNYQFKSFADCGDLLNTTIERGNADLTFTTPYEGYAVTVKVIVDDLFTPFTQLILGVPGSPPIVFIKYDIMINPLHLF